MDQIPAQHHHASAWMKKLLQLSMPTISQYYVILKYYKRGFAVAAESPAKQVTQPNPNCSRTQLSRAELQISLD